MLRRALLCAAACAPGQVWASGSTGGGATVTISSTSLTLGIDEVQAACDANDSADAITFTLNGSQTQAAAGYTLFVWWEDASNKCDDVPDDEDDRLEDTDLDSNHTLLDDGDMTFPDDTDEIDEFTERTVADIVAACDANAALSSEQMKLCIGVDTNNDDTITEATEYNAYVLFEVDTDAPPAPDTPTITEADGQLSLSTAVSASGESDDIESWTVLYRVLDANGTDANATDCTTWTNATSTDVTGDETQTSVTVSSLTNGSTYELCVLAVDDAGNDGAASAIVTGTPQEECDFMECYPGKITTGYCAAMPASLWLCVGLLGMLRRRRRA